MSPWITELWPIWLFVAFGVLSIAHFVRIRWIDSRGWAMKRAIRELGGETDARGVSGELTVNGVRIEVETVPQSESRPLLRHFAARARFVRGSGPTFCVRLRGEFETGARFGEVPAFDDRCLVALDDEDAARAAWSERAQRMMSGLVDARESREGWWRAVETTAESDGRLVMFQRRVQFKRVASYRTAFALLAELARDPAADDAACAEPPAAAAGPYRPPASRA